MAGQDPTPTNPHVAVDQELRRWSGIYGGDEYYYGAEPGPVARRAVRYHHFSPGAAALDVGCGEGQDLAYLAGLGYAATGVEFTAAGAQKSRLLLAERGVAAQVVEADARAFLTATPPPGPYDLAIAANSLQFLGPDASECLDRLMGLVLPGGVLGLSLFGREPERPEVSGTVYFTTLDDLLARFQGWQPLEAAKLWQWNVATNQPQPFVTLIARKLPPRRPQLIALR
ncbi:MAG: class I SAM-dependent methyltransferase [Actinomycetota bacterium]